MSVINDMQTNRVRALDHSNIIFLILIYILISAVKISALMQTIIFLSLTR